MSCYFFILSAIIVVLLVYSIYLNYRCEILERREEERHSGESDKSAQDH